MNNKDNGEWARKSNESSKWIHRKTKFKQFYTSIYTLQRGLIRRRGVRDKGTSSW